MIVLVPPTVSRVDLFNPVLTRLCDLLRKHNKATEPRIRLRIALHAGEVLRGPCGWISTDLNTACRLVNGAPLYRELLHNPQTDLVLVVSDTIHQAVCGTATAASIHPSTRRCMYESKKWTREHGLSVHFKRLPDNHTSTGSGNTPSPLGYRYLAAGR